MTELAMLLGFGIFLLCSGVCLLHSSRLGRLTLIDWAMLGMGGVYGCGWVIVSWVTARGGNSFWEDWLLPYDTLYPIHSLCVVVLIAGAWCGWLAAGEMFLGRCHSAVPSRAADRQLARVMWLLLGIAFSLQYIYTRAYGGFLGLLKYSNEIRSAIFTVENPWSFLQPFGGLALFSSFGFWGLWLSGRRTGSVAAGLFISCGFSLYVLYSRLGRIQFLVYMAALVLGLLLMRRLRPTRLIAVGGVAMLLILVSAYYISLLLNLKPAHSLPEFLARELAFPFGSFFAELNSGDHLLRGFQDFLYIPIYALPSSVWSRWIEEVSQVNTTLIMGAPMGEQGVTGGIPVDLVTLGLMQANVLGIVIVGALFGFMLRFVQRWLDRIPSQGVGAVLSAYVALKVAVLGIFYAQPALVVKENFDLLVSVIVISIALRQPRRRSEFPQVVASEVLPNRLS